MELLHVATLIHDDVVDDATIRRGFPSLNFVWKNKLSVLMGDFLLSKALINMIRIKDFDALERISITAEKLSAGEILQIEKSMTRSMDEATYFDMIGQKTASLISKICELGAITTTKKEIDRNRLMISVIIWVLLSKLKMIYSIYLVANLKLEKIPIVMLKKI